jgi:hypothetical protein
MYSWGRQQEVLAREILLELLESRTFTVLFQRLLVLVTRIEVSEMVCGMSKSTVDYVSTMQMISVPSLFGRMEALIS